MSATLALMVRSLRVDARQMRTHLFHVLFIALIYFMMLQAQRSSMSFGAPGLTFFSRISFLNFFMIVLAGVSFFATTITEEKEEATLGLLKMAGVSPIAILLGKSAPRLISAALLLSVQFPFTLLAITLGGVTWHQVFATYCSLLAFLVLVANMGLFLSVYSKTSSKACWRLAFVLILLFIIIPWIQLMMSFRRGPTPGPGFLQRFSPQTRLQEILQTGFAESAFGFQFFSNLAVGAVFFGLSWLTFNHFTRHDDSASAPSRGPLLKATGRFKLVGSGRAWTNSLIWKDFHFIAGGWGAMIIKCMAYPVLTILFGRVFSFGGSDWSARHLGEAAMSLGVIVFLVESSWYAGSVFRSEIKWGTFSTLMQLPISIGAIAYSKAAGCLIGLVPAVSLFFMGAMLSATRHRHLMEEMLTEPGAWLIYFLMAFFIHLVALLSLFVKWGVLPLAMAVFFVLYLISIACFTGSNSGDEIVFLLLVVVGSGIVACEVAIGARLQALAGK